MIRIIKGIVLMKDITKKINITFISNKKVIKANKTSRF